MTFSDGQLTRRFERLPEFLTSDLCHLSLAGLVVLAGSPNPIPSRTRPLNSPAPMVLSLKAWKSRSLPGLPRPESVFTLACRTPPRIIRGGFLFWRLVGAHRPTHVSRSTAALLELTAGAARAGIVAAELGRCSEGSATWRWPERNRCLVVSRLAAPELGDSADATRDQVRGLFQGFIN